MGMMSQTLPPVPTRGAAPPTDDTGAPPLAQAPQESQQANEAKDKAENITAVIRKQRFLNESMAAHYPAAAKEFRAANEALKAAQLKITRELQQTPGSNPAPAVGPG